MLPTPEPSQPRKATLTGLWKQYGAAILGVAAVAYFLLFTFGWISIGPLLLTIFGYAIWQGFRRERDESAAIGESLRVNRIDPAELPVEFRFITNQTTVGELLAKVGPYARKTTKNGLACYEYDLPYHATVLVFPEPPGLGNCRIRTVFFRKPREDDDSMAL